jgi:hypothetical protein
MARLESDLGSQSEVKSRIESRTIILGCRSTQYPSATLRKFETPTRHCVSPNASCVRPAGMIAEEDYTVERFINAFHHA